MEAPVLLHPMGIMEIFFKSLRIYFQKFHIFMGLCIVIYGVPIIMLMLGETLFTQKTHPLRYLLIVLAYIILYASIFYYYATTTLVVSHSLMGVKAGFFQTLRQLRGAMALHLLGTGILASLAVLGGLILLIIPGVILWINYLFAPPLVVLERIAYRRALRRSGELVKGYWWRVFWAFWVCYLFLVLFSVVVGLIIAVIIYMIFGETQMATIVMAGFFLVSFMFLFTMPYVFQVLLYYDIRIRKEAMGLEMIQETVQEPV